MPDNDPNQTPLSEDEQQFITLLNEATRLTGIYIGGCGCCGSPFLGKVDLKEGEYIWENDGHHPENIEWKDATDA